MSKIGKAFEKLKEFYPEGSVFLVLEREQADSIVAQAIAQHNRELLSELRSKVEAKAIIMDEPHNEGESCAFYEVVKLSDILQIINNLSKEER